MTMPKAKQAAQAAALDFNSYLEPHQPLETRPRVDGILLVCTDQLRMGHWSGEAEEQGLALLKQAMPDLGTYIIGRDIDDVGEALPRGMPWTAYPVTPAPVWRHHRRGGMKLFPDYVIADSPVPGQGILLADAISTAQWVACIRPARGPGSTAYQAETDYRFARWLELLPREHSERLRLISCTPGDTAALELGPLDRAIAYLQSAGSPAMRLDYQYHVNALAVFGAIWRRACVGMGFECKPLPSILTTVFGLQLLYHLANRGTPQWNERGGRLWKGTGRYAAAELPYSDRTRAVLFSLVEEGLIGYINTPTREQVERGEIYYLSRRARAFLDLLHPDCCDPDVLLRWRDPATGLIRSGSEQAIDAWTKRFFGRAKNKLDRLTASAVARKPASPPRAAAPEG